MTTPTNPKRRTGRPPGSPINDPDPARTGATLRQIRLDRDVTQQELATAMGYRYAQSVVQIETGYRPVSDGKLIKAARYLGVPPLSIRRTDPDAEKTA